MIKEASATICLFFPSEKETSIIERALNPETRSSPRYRSRVELQREGRNLMLVFKAEDTSALRSSINSYVSWLQLLNDIYNAIDDKGTMG